MPSGARGRIVLASFLLFFSGAAGLGYQVLWGKLLLEFIGVSAWSYAVVLAAFMTGLALGSRLFGGRADRTPRPLRLYGWLELGVGFYAVLYPTLSEAVGRLYASFVVFTPDQAGADYRLWAKALASGLLLLPPTLLMGGTYPAMLRHAVGSTRGIGRMASLLYGVNAAGAFAGTLLMTFAVMPRLGLRASLMLLAVVNTLVALCAFMAPAAPPPTPIEEGSENEAEAPSAERLSDARVRLLLALLLVEGFVAFSYEIAWTRYFAIVLGSSTYSFAVMLSAYISGIALGGLLLAAVDARVRRPGRIFAATQVALGAVILLPLPLYPRLPWLLGRLREALSTNPLAFYLFELLKLGLSYLVMLPATMLMGMALPLAIKALGRSRTSIGQVSARVYAWNTWGNVAGALVAGLWLLPGLGLEGLFRAGGAVNLLLGVAASLALAGTTAAGRSTRLALPLAVLAGLTGLQILSPRWDHGWFTLGAFQSRGRTTSHAETRDRLRRQQVLLHRDDPAADLLVWRVPGPDGDLYDLQVNGKVDASNGADMATQVLLGEIPAVLHPNPRQAMVIGLGSGVTAGALLDHDLERVDVVEIVQSMEEAARIFAPYNGNALDDPRLHVIHDDGRSYLRLTRARYDLIVSEPSNPWIAGTGALFSRDFYQMAASRLKPGGLFVQWLQAYESSDQTFAAVLRSFRRAFPHIYVFQGASTDLILVGALTPLVPDWDRMEARLKRPRVSARLAPYHVATLSGFLHLQTFSPLTADWVAASTDRENDDDNLLLEYRAPRDMFRAHAPELPRTLDERNIASPQLLANRRLRERPGSVDPADYLRLFSDDGARSRPDLRLAFALSWLHLHEASIRDIPRDLIAAFPHELQLLPLPSPETVATQLAEGIRDDRAGELERLLGYYGAAAIYEATLSPATASAWIKPLAPAFAEHGGKGAAVRLGVFWGELLAAGGRREQALAVVRDYIHGAPPTVVRKVLRDICLLDPTTLCDEAVARASLAADDGTLARFAAIRSGRPW